MCLPQPVAVVSRRSRLRALGLGVPATGPAHSPSADPSPLTGIISAGNRGVTGAVEVPSSPVRRGRQPKGRHALVHGHVVQGESMHCQAVNALSGLAASAPEAAKDDQGAGEWVPVRPDPVAAVRAGGGRAHGSHVGCQDGQGLGSSTRRGPLSVLAG